MENATSTGMRLGPSQSEQLIHGHLGNQNAHDMSLAMHHGSGSGMGELIEIDSFCGVKQYFCDGWSIILRPKKSVADQGQALAFVNCYQYGAVGDLLE